VTAPKVGSLNCPNCGAGIQLRGFEYTQNVICDSCHAVLDATDPNLTILQKFKDKHDKTRPKIPLGTRGQWHGAQWEAIGFQRRRITVDGTNYSWDEYLLFNPYKGFRYLTEYEGHWNDVIVLRTLPTEASAGGRPTASLHGETFRAFQTATAYTDVVLGEFPWQVRVGDKVVAQDFVSPPRMLSSERTDDEVTWSLGEYVAGDRIWQAFKLPGSAPTPVGVYANQPSPTAGRSSLYWKAFGLFAAALFALFVVRMATASNAPVFTTEHRFTPGARDTVAFVTETFTVAGHTSGLDIKTEANVAQSWIVLGMTLVDANTGQTIDFGREVSYYYGSDEDGAWTEGSTVDRVRIPAVPAGTWFLRIEADGPATGPSIDYTISVRRDVASPLFFGLALVAMLLPAIFVSIRSASFETRRWAESDYAPKSSSTDDD
jgi:hypothetical protein